MSEDKSYLFKLVEQVKKVAKQQTEGKKPFYCNYCSKGPLQNLITNWKGEILCDDCYNNMPDSEDTDS